jgi:dihydrofolate reductase
MKVQYFTACTMDGFIADENDSLDWLFEAPHHPDDHFWDEWFPTVGGLVWGATTYEGHIERSGLGADSWREYFGDRPNWIFSHHELPLVPEIDLRVVEGDVRAVHAEAAAELGEKTLWLVGGGELVGQFYDAGLVDELIVELVPVTLGKGAPVLPRRITSKNLAFRDSNLIGQRLMVRLDVTRTEPN